MHLRALRGKKLTAFDYLNQELHCDSVSLTALAAEFGTPLYVYSANRLSENYRRFAAAFAPLRPTVCYSVKANANLSILRVLKDEGAGFDIVSGGELFRVLKVGADPARIVFAGVGKTESEIESAIKARVGWLNVESEGELRRVNEIAGRLRARPAVALRLRPDVEADTHYHIRTGSAASKFGVSCAAALELVRLNLPHVEVRGAHVHIGSQLANPDATVQAIAVALEFIAKANALGAEIDSLDLGGGFPVQYRDDEPVPSVESFAAPVVARLADSGLKHFHLEPGRCLVADCAVLVTTVQYEKTGGAHRIVIVDAGMQTLLRPALYDACHRILPIQHPPSPSGRGAGGEGESLPADVAGPICESADFLARGQSLPPPPGGDLLAVLDVGAYGFSMASNYNAHPLPAEVLIENNTFRLIRRRQTYEDLIAHEVI